MKQGRRPLMVASPSVRKALVRTLVVARLPLVLSRFEVFVPR